MFLFNIQPLYNGIQQCMLRVHDYHFCPLALSISSISSFNLQLYRNYDQATEVEEMVSRLQDLFLARNVTIMYQSVQLSRHYFQVYFDW